MKKSTLFTVFASLITPLIAEELVNHAHLNKRLFTLAYERNSWGSPESRSGEGSTLKRTTAIRRELSPLLEQYKIKSVLDAPCGDFNWMKEVDLSCLDYYIGVDIVEALIKTNMERYGSSKRHFFVLDIVNQPLPQVDLIVCRDCMQHLIEQDVKKLIANIKRSGSKYLLANTYTTSQENVDIDNIYATTRLAYRNLLIPPFSLPTPLLTIEEGFENKVLMLWRIEDLPDL